MSLAFASERVPQRQPHRQRPAPADRHLAVVPEESRRTVSYVVFVMATILALVAIVIGFQAFIAEQQLKLDRVTTDLGLARLNYDGLRQQRADLLAPDYLREKARLMGMAQGLGSRFMEVPADIVAEVVAATGKMDPAFAEPGTSLLAQPGGFVNLFQSSEVRP